MPFPVRIHLLRSTMEDGIAGVARLVSMDDGRLQHALEGIHDVDLPILGPQHILEISHCPPGRPSSGASINLRSHLKLAIGEFHLSTRHPGARGVFRPSRAVAHWGAITQGLVARGSILKCGRAAHTAGLTIQRGIIGAFHLALGQRLGSLALGGDDQGPVAAFHVLGLVELVLPTCFACNQSPVSS